MMTFLTILAFIWFVTMTVFGNVITVKAIMKKPSIVNEIKGWPFLVDIVVVAFLITRLMGKL